MAQPFLACDLNILNLWFKHFGLPYKHFDMQYEHFDIVHIK
jgi:hypothetical protein